MDAKPHYFKIGIFVLIAIALIVVAIVVFGAGLLAHDELLFESYFAESITGLSVGSPLEFRGVRIGQVSQIGFVGNTYKLPTEDGLLSPYAPYVRVVTAVPRSKMPDFAVEQVEEAMHQMIARGLRMRITSNILTGQAYLEMNYLDPNRFPVEEVPWQPIHLVIPSAPGELTTIKDSIDKVLNQLQSIDVEGLTSSLEKLFLSLNTAISDADLAEMSLEARALLQVSRQKIEGLEVDKINASTREFLASLNQALAEANIPQLSQQMRSVLTTMDQKMAALDMVRLNADMERLLGTLNQSVADANVPALSSEAQGLIAELRVTNMHLKNLLAPPEGMTTRANLPEVVERLNRTLSQLNKVLATERPEIQTILVELRETMDGLNDLISTLRERPSELLFSNPPRPSEVLK
ncbi:MAG: MlaD family protein [Solirubrobacterales bacterium]